MPYEFNLSSSYFPKTLLQVIIRYFCKSKSKFRMLHECIPLIFECAGSWWWSTLPSIPSLLCLKKTGLGFGFRNTDLHVHFVATWGSHCPCKYSCGSSTKLPVWILCAQLLTLFSLQYISHNYQMKIKHETHPKCFK